MTQGPYNVFYEDGEWKVKRDGASRSSATADTREEAERKANALASRRNETVVVHNKSNDGFVQYKPR